MLVRVLAGSSVAAVALVLLYVATRSRSRSRWWVCLSYCCDPNVLGLVVMLMLSALLFAVWAGALAPSPSLAGSPTVLAVAGALLFVVAFQHRLRSGGAGGLHVQMGQPFAHGFPLALRTRGQLLGLSEAGKVLLDELMHCGAVRVPESGGGWGEGALTADWAAIYELAGRGFIRPFGPGPWPAAGSAFFINPFVALQVQWLTSRGLWSHACSGNGVATGPSAQPHGQGQNSG